MTETPRQSLSPTLPRLQPRLAACLDFIPEHAGRLLDVGCDHALVSCHALRTGKVRRIIASDLREGPLRKAALNLQRYAEPGCYQIWLRNGLEPFGTELDPDRQSGLQAGDVILLAGLGGLEIHDILVRAFPLFKAYAASRRAPLSLIIQAQKSHAILRLFLESAGFVWERERWLADGLSRQARCYRVQRYRFVPSRLGLFTALLRSGLYAERFRASTGGMGLAAAYFDQASESGLARLRQQLSWSLSDALIYPRKRIPEGDPELLKAEISRLFRTLKTSIRHAAFIPGFARLDRQEALWLADLNARELFDLYERS